MERRKFLKFLSLSSILSLGSPSTLLAMSSGRFTSETLGFTLSFPLTWQASTALEDIDHYLAEWGGHKEDHTPPLILLSKYKEPTELPNYEFRVYALDPSELVSSTIDIETAKATFEYISSQYNEISDLNTSIDCSLYPWSGFAASWRSKGIGNKYDFLGYFFLITSGPSPLLFITCQPRTADDSEIVSILKSFRNTK